MTAFTAVYLLGNLVLAQRWQHPPALTTMRLDETHPRWLPPYNVERSRSASLPAKAALRLRSLLPLTLGLSVLVGLLLLYYGQLAVHYWQDGATLSNPFAARLNPKNLWHVVTQLIGQIWLMGGVLGVTIALLIYPRLVLRAIAVVLSLLFG